jgi:dienelactone hydrolase
MELIMERNMKIIRKWWWIPIIIIAFGLTGFVFWAKTTSPVMPEAIAAMASDEQVIVNTKPWITFTPVQEEYKTGLIFYPGGKVDPRAYAPIAKEIASRGTLVVIVPMPLNLAVFAPSSAADVISAYPEVKVWVVGGHSLGGSMAANFARKNPSLVKGLLLLASYPASSDDLSKFDLPVLSIYGSLDGLATREKIDASIPLLPSDTIWKPIDGGNHGQFGWYGNQAGDNQAIISREEQQKQTVDAIDSFLDELKNE